MGFLSDVFKGSGGSIVSGVLDAAGGILGNNAKQDMFSQAQALSREQFEYQKALHQNQIQWRVEDAKRAGVHPMAALGLSSMSFSPVSSASVPEYDNWLGEVGQNIDRAIQQGKTQKEREEAKALQEIDSRLALRNKELQNDLLETELADKRFRLQQQMFPAPPPANSPTGLIPGQGDALTNPQAMRTTPQTEPGKEPGSNPPVGWLQNSDGSVSPVMSEAAKERLEDDLVGEAQWTISNRVLPHLKWFTGFGDMSAHYPPKSLLPEGYKTWRYNGFGRYVPVR